MLRLVFFLEEIGIPDVSHRAFFPSYMFLSNRVSEGDSVLVGGWRCVYAVGC